MSASPAGIGQRQTGKGSSSENGSAVIELPLILGLLLLPFGLLVLVLPTWVERQTAARDAAAEVARLVVVREASGPTPTELLRQVELGYGLAPGSLRLDDVVQAVPGGSVTVRVTVVLPSIGLPLFGELGSRSWSAEHTERAPDYGAFE